MPFNHSPMDTREQLQKAFQKYQYAISDSHLERLSIFHERLRAANRELNLTRLYNLDTMVRKHYIDSLIILDVVKEKFKLHSPIMDLGSGGGFPGIPLAIVRPDLTFILVEGRKQRTDFLSEVVRELKLENVSVVSRKLQSTDQIDVKCIITRAFSGMPETAVRTEGSLSIDGHLIFMKGPNCNQELAEMRSFKHLELFCDEHYTLPQSADRRRLVIFRKVRPANSEMQSEQRGGKASRTPDTISSFDNDIFKKIRSMDTGKAIKKLKQTLIAGRKIVPEILERFPDMVDSIIYRENHVAFSESDRSKSHNIRSFRFSRELFAEVDFFNTDSPLLIARIPDPLDSAELKTTEPMIIIATGDPDNTGAIIRSAAAFGFRQVLLLREAAHPYHPRAIRSSSGAVFTCKLFSGPGIADFRADYPLYILGNKGTAIESIDANEVPAPALLIGEEGQGTEKLSSDTKRLSTTITISQTETIESLNAAIAAGIALHHFRKI